MGSLAMGCLFFFCTYNVACKTLSITTKSPADRQGCIYERFVLDYLICSLSSKVLLRAALGTTKLMVLMAK